MSIHISLCMSLIKQLISLRVSNEKYKTLLFYRVPSVVEDVSTFVNSRCLSCCCFFGLLNLI